MTVMLLAENVEDIMSTPSDMEVTLKKVVTSDSVTHIEIIKTKKSASRRVSGASRVVPFITSAWQQSSSNASEQSITKAYAKILFENECGDDRECLLCNLKFLTSAEVCDHLEKKHPSVTISQEPCFVCRKKYFLNAQIKAHLAKVHEIQYPEMICKICFMQFHTTMERKAHERKHGKEFICPFCSTKFASEYFYQNHFHQHMLKLKPLECKTCGKRFENKTVFDIHKNRHLQLNCFGCDSLFTQELQLLQHIKDYGHEKKVSFLHHTKLLDDEEDQLENMLKTYNKTLTECNETLEADVTETIRNCMDSILASVEHADRDDLRTLPVEKPELECKLCSLRVSSAMSLMDHHQKSHPRNRTCLFCGTRSSSVSQTRRHMTTHVKRLNASLTSAEYFAASTNSCHICNKTSKSKCSCKSINTKSRTKKPQSNTSVVAQHSKHEEQKVTKNLSNKSVLHCKVCHRGFVKRKFLERHEAQHESIYTCNHCNKKCPSLVKLRSHIILSHAAASERQKFGCKLCPVVCSTNAGLRVHERVHTDERPFKCDKCELQFKRAQALKRHVLQIHRSSDSVLFSCRECKVRFRDRWNLVRHYLRLHKGLCRFICGICGFRYGQNLDLKRHLKMKHQVDVPVLRGSTRKSMKEIYVIPPLDANSVNTDLGIKITKIVQEEELKFDGVFDFLSAAVGDPDDPDEPDTESTTTGTDFTNPCAKILNKTSSSQSNSVLKPDVSAGPTGMPEQTEHLPVMPRDKEISETPTEYLPILESMNLQACDLCSALFYPDNHYQQHILQRENNSCLQCPKKFCEQTTLLEHVAKDHSTQPICYRCGICLLDYSEKNDLVEHMESIHGVLIQFEVTPDDLSNASKKFSLNNPISSYDMIPVTVHEIEERSCANLTTFHTKETSIPIFPSEETPNPTSTNQNVPSALISSALHTLTTPIAVDNMLLDQSQISANVEAITAQPNSDILGSCTTVTFIEQMPSESGVEVESTVPAADETNNLTCMQCNKQFPEIGQLLRHVNSHLGLKPYKCPDAECGKMFSEKCNLKVHLRSHTGERPFSCDQCGKRQRYQRDHKLHKQMHQGVKPYRCTNCQMMFQRQGDLNRHMLTHTGIKTHHCEVCNKFFSRFDELKAHNLSHARLEDSNLFICDHCSKGFKLKSTLRKHLILHSKVKAYQCQVCKRSFALECYLKTHLKIHQREYVPCLKCPRKFTSHDNLEVHLKKFHVSRLKQRPHTKSFCDNSVTSVKSPAVTEIVVNKDTTELIDIGSGMEMMDLEMHEEELLSAVDMLNADSKSGTVIYFQMVQDHLEHTLINLAQD